ncbi:MAG: hypothetical protein AAGG75_27965 [Bacteroidota bacterium]
MCHYNPMNQDIKMYAPYTYWCRLEGQAIIDLYLLVPVASRECLEIYEPAQFGNKLIIDAEVILGDDAILEVDQGRFVSHHFRFAYETDGDQTDWEDLSIIISINNDSEVLAKTTLCYEDSDEVYFERRFDGGLAMNCPYTYLHRPSNFNPLCYHDPSVLVPIEGYKFLEPAEELMMSTARNGICEDTVLLVKDENIKFQIIAPPKLNKVKFRDTSEQYSRGCLSVTILLFDEADGAWDFLELSYEERNEFIQFKEMIEDAEKIKNEIHIRTKHADTTPVFAFVSNEN